MELLFQIGLLSSLGSHAVFQRRQNFPPLTPYLEEIAFQSKGISLTLFKNRNKIKH